MCRWLGVDKIGLIDNNANVTAAIADILAPFIESGFVDLEAWGNDTPAQREAFNRCFQKFKDSYDWVAFFDADEYLMLLERCAQDPMNLVALPTRLLTSSW